MTNNFPLGSDVITTPGKLLLISEWDHSIIRVITESCTLFEAFDLASDPHHERDHYDIGGCVIFVPNEVPEWADGWFWYEDDLIDKDPDAIFYLNHKDEDMLNIDRHGKLGIWYPSE